MRLSSHSDLIAADDAKFGIGGKSRIDNVGRAKHARPEYLFSFGSISLEYCHRSSLGCHPFLEDIPWLPEKNITVIFLRFDRLVAM